MKPLINDKVNNKLNEIVKKLFEGNRILDRCMTEFSVKFAMNNTEGQLHPKLAHLYPKLADVISDYQSARDCLTIYGETPLDDSDYNSPLDIFNKILEYQEDLESLVAESIDTAKEDSDYTTKVVLDKFLLDIVPVMNQILLLVDKAESYKDWMMFDADIEKFIILE
jgi:ferritin